MNELLTKGLQYEEDLLWEKSHSGLSETSFPERDSLMDQSLPKDFEGLLRDDNPLPNLSEPQIVRHFTRLSTWNYNVDAGMYPLGSCTMKYNPRTNERQAALKGFSELHPLVGDEFSQGALRIIYETEKALAEITGMQAVSLQPAAGAHGEFLGMQLFYAYHKAKGKPRTKILIPDTAHGTNPASAAFCGFQPVEISSGADGILHPDSVRALMDEDTAGIMITNPNTLGLFEANIREIAQIVHQKGGLVYGDGANMNALLGRIKPGEIGMDAMHLNLHKTFSTPHGGGGPGSGPLCVAEKLVPFLPLPRVFLKDGIYFSKEDLPQSIGKIHGFYGNFGSVIKALAYFLSLGESGLSRVANLAVLNANYIRSQLKETYHLAYSTPSMHECVFTAEKQEKFEVTTMDIAKRLLDYGIHPPTVYFPLVVKGALMIEPTETESPDDIDRFITIMKKIAEEAKMHSALFHDSPRFCIRRRMDDVLAARKPVLRGLWNTKSSQE